MTSTLRTKSQRVKPAGTEADGVLAFDHQLRTRIIFGVNSVERAGELARDMGVRKILLVTDPGLAAAGHAERVGKIFADAGVSVALYDRVRENPSTRDVGECLAVAKSSGIDAIAGLGGGSSMDTAKGANFLLTNGGRMQDYWGMGKARLAMLPFIAIPTTSGTGSECQSFALIADEQTHQKMACGDTKAAARIAILDPALTLSQPPRVTACTGIDAISHAVETAVTRRRSGLSLMYSREAFRLAAGSFPVVIKSPKNVAARGRMLLGAALAGLAIENSMLGAAHAAANPLTARHGIPHGQAVGMMLPIVVRFNGRDPAARRAYAGLASAAELASLNEGEKAAWMALIGRLEALLNLAGMPRSLADCGVKKLEIKALAQEAAQQWTAGFNPRTVTGRDFEKMYATAFEPRGDGDGN